MDKKRCGRGEGNLGGKQGGAVCGGWMYNVWMERGMMRGGV